MNTWENTRLSGRKPWLAQPKRRPLVQPNNLTHTPLNDQRHHYIRLLRAAEGSFALSCPMYRGERNPRGPAVPEPARS